MWFNNALIYQYEFTESLDFNQLSGEKLKPCPPHARFIYGWLPILGEAFAQEIAGSALISLGKEERILPRGVIHKFLNERIQTIETIQGRKVKRTEKAQIMEELEFELLPKAFCVQKRLLALLDTASKRLIINTASETQAIQLTSLLRKSLPTLQLAPFCSLENLATRFANWIVDPASLPPSFQLANDCLLFSLNNEKKRVACRGYDLPAEEIVTLLSQGLVAAELSLIWNDRIQFTLTQNLTFKRLKSLDYLIDEFNEINKLEEELLQRDAALTLLSGELRHLINDLLTGLSCQKANLSTPESLIVSEM